ncbi:hypothetical protein [Porphyrobacter sp. CACIAM 03H1]|jgi:hypothetical protein|uniref:hypothetical protein n=1 Tax=Porphyrobacter sp. CACIAM 03H1 TaxID=2003315 RepID=UPI000B5A3C0A|nr:hypothetical protein [Porphyrobacter sp. CACIAM 03H1]ASJ90009.1 hypothetical protein CBR61_03035 [Porphyrobacter sp. CACIAM 03H1]
MSTNKEFLAWDYHLASEGHSIPNPDFLRAKLNQFYVQGWSLLTAVPYTERGQEGFTTGIMHYMDRVARP